MKKGYYWIKNPRTGEAEIGLLEDDHFLLCGDEVICEEDIEVLAKVEDFVSCEYQPRKNK